jgi:hypothetical protein
MMGPVRVDNPLNLSCIKQEMVCECSYYQQQASHSSESNYAYLGQQFAIFV